ncbi:MAG: hypothetical protein IT367_04295, partial [Candidatus Hydrogenedentes bacterium]|nr:hypothetical protein [Candidatus Hydrogenedentota bacterium]
DVPTGCDAFVEALREAEHHARVLASGETVTNESELLRDALQNILRSFDELDDQPKPFDLAALLRETFSVSATEEPVRFETSAAAGIPPQSLRRNRMLRLFSTVQRLGRAALLHGGVLRSEMDYAMNQRAVTVFINGEGKTDRERAEVYVPAIERAVAAHAGSIETDFSDSGFTVLIFLPDQIALALDEWLPGWDTFAPRSIQMLRLLKSGGPVPPEELILNGVLEDELERRLLPRLGIAPAATLIHDLKPRKPDLTPSSPQRIEKVLAQLKRGKPKKEICAPVYAAEILYMYAIDQRHASAIGVENFNSPNTIELAKVLSATPLNLLGALRLLTQVLNMPA